MTQANRDTVTLEGCNWNPRNVTEIGCMEGALTFLGVDVSAGWLAGGIGYAFFPYIPGDCGGDPGYWTHEQYRGRLHNIGCRVTAFLSDQAGQKEDVVDAIHRGRPCVFFSWEAGEYVLLKGIKPDGMVLSFYGGNEVVRPWKDLAGAFSLRTGQAAPPDKVVQEALGLALQFHAGTKTLSDFGGYYGCWKQMLDASKTFGWGVSLTARRMAELRGFAPQFLRDAASRMGGETAGLLRNAAETYETASATWRQLAELIPFPNRTTEQRQAYTTDAATVKLIRPVIDTIVAKESEGVERLGKIMDKLG